MNEKLLDYIKSLTGNDKKTLTEKVAKLFEEGGELAKVVLPYEGAYATNHRMVDKKRLLEEVVDVFLVNQSILYSLGFTDDEFENMAMKKPKFGMGFKSKRIARPQKGIKCHTRFI